MKLYEIIAKHGKGKGEDVMRECTKIISEFISPMEDSNNTEYWYLLRKIYGLMCGGHYDEDFAKHDVAEMLPHGEYWSMKQIDDATKSMSFPSGTTLCDKYVAFNAFANDLCGVLPDDQILKSAHAFWFNDKDWKGKNKIWEYMCLAHKY